MFDAPLAVRLSTAAADKHVTRRLKELTFRKVAPGGIASIELDFDQSLATTDPAVGLYGKVYITDGRHGGVIAEGRQEDPGRSASSEGQVWSLQAFGPAAHADDNRVTVCYVETGLETWLPSAQGRQGVTVGANDNDPPALKVQFPGGMVLATNSPGVTVNRVVRDCGGKLARVKAAWSTVKTDANYEVNLWTRVGAGTLSAAAKSALFNVAGGTLAAVITTDFTAGDDSAYFGIEYLGAGGTVGDDTTYVTTQPLLVQQTRYTAAGVEQTTGATYASDTILASDVVADLLGRALPGYDGAGASIATTSFAIDRLVYTDPTSPAQILDDLMTLESNHFWRAGPSTASGGYSFEWLEWPSTVRYEASINAPFNSPGNAGEVYNRVIVRYRDRNGRSRNVVRTLAQADLDAAGLTRTGDLDLGDVVGSTANASQAGDRFLLDHNSPPNAGTIDINQPTLDLVAGRMVAPWELEPGNLIRVRGVLPRVDALNATDRDAVSVFRVVAVNYTASTNTATLELDSLGRGTADEIYAAHRRIDKLRKR